MNNAYPLIPVSILILLAYTITWLFARLGIFSYNGFRKFWNILLLATFLVSGLLGIFSVIKINYKLTIPGYEQYLQWHVSAGSAMVFISFIHLSWHLKYYLPKGKARIVAQPEPDESYNPSDAPKYRFLLFLLGSSTMIGQVVFVREFMSVMSGNELVLGIMMAAWLLLTALGAFAGKKIPVKGFSPGKGWLMVLALPVFMMATIASLYWLKQLLFPPGTLAGMGAVVSGAFLLLYPGCFLSGYLFTRLSSLYSGAKGGNFLGTAYAAESLGSLAGGLLFSLVLIFVFDSFQGLGFLTVLILLTGIWLRPSKTFQRFLLGGTAILILTGIFLLKPMLFLKGKMFPNQLILSDRSTPYGDLVVTRQAGQLNFYENNNLQFYTDNLMANEEVVHFAMTQHPSPKKILLVSGGISGMIKEILKYDVDKITYLEVNPAMVKRWKELSGTGEFPSKVEFIARDIRVFLQSNKAKYDVILLNFPPPSTLGTNRFYTSGFFNLIKQNCLPAAVVSTSLPSTANYAGGDELEVNSSLWATLGKHFSNRLVLQGEKNYFLASDGKLSAEVASLISVKGIKNEYVNSDYFEDELTRQRSEQMMSEFSATAKINTDLEPAMFIRQVFHWLNLFGTSYYLIAGIPILVFIFLFFKMNAITTGVYVGGFTAASLEVLLMFVFQTQFGSLYIAIAIFFTVFMGGLAAGSWWGNRIKPQPDKSIYFRMQLYVAAFSLLLPLTIILIPKITYAAVVSRAFFYLLVFALSVIAGFEFYLAARLQPASIRQTSALNYSSDLAGSAFGALLTTLVLIPLLGVVFTCFVVAGLNLYSAGRVYFFKT
jgi:spermidine synthase